jgi:hypothetical protein
VIVAGDMIDEFFNLENLGDNILNIIPDFALAHNGITSFNIRLLIRGFKVLFMTKSTLSSLLIKFLVPCH